MIDLTIFDGAGIVPGAEQRVDCVFKLFFRVDREWRTGLSRGFVTRSLVVIGVRPGNPRGIATWEDLARPGVELVW